MRIQNNRAAGGVWRGAVTEKMVRDIGRGVSEQTDRHDRYGVVRGCRARRCGFLKIVRAGVVGHIGVYNKSCLDSVLAGGSLSIPAVWDRQQDVLSFTVISVGAGRPSSYPSNSFIAESSGMCSNVTTGVSADT